MVGFDSLEEAKTRPGLPYMFPEERPFVNTVLWPSVLEKGSCWRATRNKIANPYVIEIAI
jgi:hypothetical protein